MEMKRTKIIQELRNYNIYLFRPTILERQFYWYIRNR